MQLGTTPDSLEGALERFAPGHGTTAARRLIEPVRGGGVSHPEWALLAGLRQAGATAWRAGVRVRVGDRNCWVDLAVRRLRLAVEVDGWKVHSRSDAFHTPTAIARTCSSRRAGQYFGTPRATCATTCRGSSPKSWRCRPG